MALAAATVLLAVLVAAVAQAAAGPGSGGPSAADGAAAPAWDLVVAASSVTFEAHDALGGFRGTLPLLPARVRLDPERPEQATARIALDPGGIDTGNALRDVNARRTVLETARFGRLELRLDAVALEGDGPLRDGAQEAFRGRGALTLHGRTRELAFAGTVALAGGRLLVDASFPVSLDAFGMARPSFLFVTVEDAVDVRVHLELVRSSDGG